MKTYHGENATRLTPHQAGLNGSIGKREAQMWRLIQTNWIQLQEMFQQLSNSDTQVIVLREAQASDAQARSVWWQSLLETLFVPLMVSGIMSMGGGFCLGRRGFGILWW
jgi:hypothetical protein